MIVSAATPTPSVDFCFQQCSGDDTGPARTRGRASQGSSRSPAPPKGCSSMNLQVSASYGEETPLTGLEPQLDIGLRLDFVAAGKYSARVLDEAGACHVQLAGASKALDRSDGREVAQGKPLERDAEPSPRLRRPECIIFAGYPATVVAEDLRRGSAPTPAGGRRRAPPAGRARGPFRPDGGVHRRQAPPHPAEPGGLITRRLLPPPVLWCRCRYLRCGACRRWAGGAGAWSRSRSRCRSGVRR